MSISVLEGLRPWIIQRVTALVIAAYIVYLVVCWFTAQSSGYEAWRDWVFAPYNSLFLGLFILSILFHAWIGMRDVVLDYIHNVILRLSILSLIMLTLIVCGLWALRILLMPLAL